MKNVWMSFGALALATACASHPVTSAGDRAPGSAATAATPATVATTAAAKTSQQISAEIQRAKAYVPAGMELAGAYVSTYDEKAETSSYKLATGEDYDSAVQRSYVFSDFNHDGHPDLAVAVEAAPAMTPDNFLAPGKRKLLIFLSDASGTLRKAAEGHRVILAADDGGAFGEPFNGLDVNQRGSLEINHYGGSKDRWGIGQTFRLINDDFFLVGETRSEMDDTTLVGQTTDTNFLTGRQDITEQRGANKKDRVTHKRFKPKALKRLSEAVAMED